MTESKLLVLDAQVNRALLAEAAASRADDDGPVSLEQTLAEIESVMGAPARRARSLLPDEVLEAAEVTDARAPATMEKAGYALLAGTGEGREGAIEAALSRAGITREMLPQLMQSEEWAGVVLRICQQWMYVTAIPKIVSAMIRKAEVGDVAASKHLVSDLMRMLKDDGVDEGTKALASAAPETVVRAIDAQIEHLSAIRADLARSKVNHALVEAAKEVAIDDLTTRKPAR